MSTDALSALASEALGNEGTQQRQQAHAPLPPPQSQQQQPEAEESLEKEEAAGGPPMPAAGLEGAALKQSIPMAADQAQDQPATKPGDALVSGAGGVGDAAMAAVDDRLDTGDLPHTNGYTQEMTGSNENPQGDGAGVAVDYGRVANLTGNEGEQVPPMSFDIDQPAAEAPKAAGEPEQGEAIPPAPAVSSAEEAAPFSLSPKPSPLPSSTDNAPIPQANSIQPPAESQQTIPQPLDSHSQPSEQATVSQLQPGQTLDQQQATPQPEQQQPPQASATSLPPLPTQPSFSPSMDSLPQDPAPLPSQLVNQSVSQTDLSQAGPESAIPASEKQQQSAGPEQAYEPSGQPTTSLPSSSFEAFPSQDMKPQQQPQQNGHASDASMSFPPTHPDLVAPPEISPSLQKRPFEPDNSAQSLPYQGDNIEPTFKRQKVSPETEDQHAFQSAMSAAGFPKPEESQQSLNQFEQQQQEQQSQHGMPVDSLLNPSSSQPQQQQQPYQQQGQQQSFGQQSQQQPFQNNAYDQGDSSMVDQSLIDQSLDMQQDQKDGESSRVESPANIEGQPSGAPSAPQPPQPTGMPKEQVKYAQAILRQIKKKSEAAPFLQPVDPVALGIPHYTQIITHPMDLGTVDRKLAQNQYEKVDDFAADVRLIWDNCVKFNGPDNPITAMAKNLSVVFEKQNAKMPTLEQIAIQKRSESPAAEKKSSKKARRSSTAGGGRTSGSARAAAYEADYDDYGPSTGGSSRSANLAAQKKKGKNPALSGSTGHGGNMSAGGMMGSSGGYGGNHQIQQMQQQQSYMLQQMQHLQGMQNGGGGMDYSQTQMKFCKEVIKELFKKQHQSFAYPFYEPVDYVALGIPDYPKVIRRPIDLGTMKRKLDAGHYPNAASFENDFKLLINNCFTYNPPMTPVHKMGEQLQQAFYEKWRELPHPQSNHWGGGYSGGYEDDYNESGFDNEQIHLMQRQLELLTGNLEMMKAKARMSRPPSYGGPGPMSMQMGMQPMQMSPVSMQMQMPPPPAPVPVQKAPRPPPAPRQPKPPSAPKQRKSDASLAASTSAPPAPPKPRTTKRSSMARGDTEWEPQPRGAGGDSDYEEPDAPADPMVSVTFDMKRELAEKIQEFDGPKLDKVVEIIRNSAPELLADENKEIELDIDMLDQRTLLKLYEYAVHPVGKGRQLKPKKNKPKGRNRGVDEVAEEERINMLQAQLDAMEGGGQLPPGGLNASTGSNPGLPAPPMDGEQAAAGAQQGGRGDVASSSSEEEDEDASESESERSNFAPED